MQYLISINHFFTASEAQRSLGFIYLMKTNRSPEDIQQGFKWLRAAAEKGELKPKAGWD